MHEKKLNFKQEIDVRGMRGDEALQAVTYFVDDAIQVGAARIRILHGTGTGILRQLIRDYLHTVPRPPVSRRTCPIRRCGYYGCRTRIRTNRYEAKRICTSTQAQAYFQPASCDRYFYAGEHDTVTRISLTQYNTDTLHTREIKTNETSFKKFVDGNSINWFQVSGLTDSEAVTRIVNEFGMHNLDAKDILTPQHVVKIEEYDKHMLIVLNSSYYDTNMEINSEHISILITGNVVISFTESNNPVFENAYKAIESDMLNIRRKNSGLLLHSF